MNPALIDGRGTSDAVALTRHAATPTPAFFCSRWWQWPHLMSLDAPLVALVWQRWWAHSADVVLPWPRAWILGLGVWLIYLADRLADTADDAFSADRTARHVFSSHRRRVLLPLAGGIALAVVILSLGCLPGFELRSGLGLLALAVGYFWLIHGWQRRGWAAYLPKEAVVGAMFGAGTIFFVVCRAPHLPATFWVAGGLFSAVCFLNCALITKWERHAQDLHEPSSLLNAFPRLSSHLRVACLLLAAAALGVAAATASRWALPVAASALLLTCLDWFESELSLETLRISADLVLLTPIFGWISSSS